MNTRKLLWTLFVCGPLVRGLAAEAGSEPVNAAPPPRFSHPRNITNPYLPLTLLQKDVLASGASRIERTAKSDLHKRFQLGAQTLDALAVEDRKFKDGELMEVTLGYFAQGDDGAVYCFGEEVDEYQGGKVTGHTGAWLFGKETQRPRLIMPAAPRVGERFRSEDIPKIARLEHEVMSVSESVSVPAGTFRNCLRIKETLSEGGVDFRYYAASVGCVKEVIADTQFLLQSRESQNAQARPAPPPQAPPQNTLQDPLARVALSLVGADLSAEAYWIDAINNPNLSAHERQDLIEDLNEEGFPDPRRPGPEDAPLIMSRLQIIEQLAPYSMDQVNLDAFAEAYKDLSNMLYGRGPQ